MLLELAVFGAASAGVVLLQNQFGRKGKSDRDKIEEVFENVKVGIPKGEGKDRYIEYPKFLDSKQDEKLPYDSYVYKVPLGIPFSHFEKLKDHLQDGLGKDIQIEFGKDVAKIKVAKQTLGTKIPLKRFLGMTKEWEVMIGVNAFELATHDFEKYPMVVGGGATRFGKTVLMKNIMTQLILQNPDDVKFYIIDLKGGLEFLDYENLKQVEKVTADPMGAFKLLGYLADEWLPKQMEYFRKNKYKNIVDTPIKERIFLIVDETHDLFKTTDPRADNKVKKKIENYMAKLAAMGGGLGFRVMAFTQYPVKEAMPQFVKQNAPVRIGFQTADGTASRVIMDQDGLEDLPGIPGRCMVKSFKYTTVQVPWYEDHFELVKQYEVVKNDKEQHTEEQREGRENSSIIGLPRLHDTEPTSTVTQSREQ